MKGEQVFKMQIDEVLKLVKKRRNIRRFKPDPVPDELLNKILETARWAMSGANAQPWEFIIVKNPETKKKILEAQLKTRKANYEIEMSRIPEMRFQGTAGPPEALAGWKHAPVVIIQMGDPRTVQATLLAAHFMGRPTSVFHVGLGNASFLIHLAATACGLGSQWVSVSTPFESDLKGILSIPNIYTIPDIIPIGYPAYEPPSNYRREVSEFLHLEKYDQSKYRTEKNIRDYIIELRNKTRPVHKI